MGWLETCAMDERMRFVAAALEREEPFSLVCRRFGVSRKTGYKWLGRYEAEGPPGLVERSRAPLRPGRMVAAALTEACLAVRRAHPRWGPLKVLAFLERQDPETAWPAASTIGALFDRAGLTVKRRLRRRTPPSTQPFGSCAVANDTWCMDFKGWFRTGDGARCGPFTLSDAMSRYLLRCQVLDRDDGDNVWPVLDAAFREYGLPLRLRSDNGPPFASRGAGGLGQLAVKVIKAGVVPERIVPGKPQQNGRLERLHLTLLQETASPPARTLRQQLARFRSFRQTYNEERPHQALAQETPAQHYSPSPRRYDGILREPDYGADEAVRRVRHNGEIKWRGDLVFIGEALVGEPVGLAETEAGWTVRYGPVELGLIAFGATRLQRPRRRPARGLVDGGKTPPTTPPAQQQPTVNEAGKVLPMSPV